MSIVGVLYKIPENGRRSDVCRHRRVLLLGANFCLGCIDLRNYKKLELTDSHTLPYTKAPKQLYIYLSTDS